MNLGPRTTVASPATVTGIDGFPYSGPTANGLFPLGLREWNYKLGLVHLSQPIRWRGPIPAPGEVVPDWLRKLGDLTNTLVTTIMWSNPHTTIMPDHAEYYDKAFFEMSNNRWMIFTLSDGIRCTCRRYVLKKSHHEEFSRIGSLDVRTWLSPPVQAPQPGVIGAWPSYNQPQGLPGGGQVPPKGSRPQNAIPTGQVGQATAQWRAPPRPTGQQPVWEQAIGSQTPQGVDHNIDLRSFAGTMQRAGPPNVASTATKSQNPVTLLERPSSNLIHAPYTRPALPPQRQQLPSSGSSIALPVPLATQPSQLRNSIQQNSSSSSDPKAPQATSAPDGSQAPHPAATALLPLSRQGSDLVLQALAQRSRANLRPILHPYYERCIRRAREALAAGSPDELPLALMPTYEFLRRHVPPNAVVIPGWDGSFTATGLVYDARQEAGKKRDRPVETPEDEGQKRRMTRKDASAAGHQTPSMILETMIQTGRPIPQPPRMNAHDGLGSTPRALGPTTYQYGQPGTPLISGPDHMQSQYAAAILPRQNDSGPMQSRPIDTPQQAAPVNPRDNDSRRIAPLQDHTAMTEYPPRSSPFENPHMPSPSPRYQSPYGGFPTTQDPFRREEQLRQAAELRRLMETRVAGNGTSSTNYFPPRQPQPSTASSEVNQPAPTFPASSQPIRQVHLSGNNQPTNSAESIGRANRTREEDTADSDARAEAQVAPSKKHQEEHKIGGEVLPTGSKILSDTHPNAVKNIEHQTELSPTQAVKKDNEKEPSRKETLTEDAVAEHANTSPNHQQTETIAASPNQTPVSPSDGLDECKSGNQNPLIGESEATSHVSDLSSANRKQEEGGTSVSESDNKIHEKNIDGVGAGSG